MGEATARELLSELLAEVTQCTYSKEVEIRPISYPDVAGVVRHHLPDRITTNFCVRRGRVEVFQLMCLEQRASGYCGHYAVFFAVRMLELRHCWAPDGLSRCIRSVADPVSFWKRYWKSISFLLEEAASCQNEWWPWTREHITSGDLERSFLTFILAADADIIAVNTDNNIQVLHYAYGLLQSSEVEVCAVQQRISKLQQSPEDQVVFILGVTNHWVTLVVHKNKYSGVCAFYLDSNNEPVLMATETQLKSLVHSREVKHIKRKGQPYSQWKKKVLYQSFVDQRDIVNLLVRCVSGETDLRGELTAQSWTKLLDSYSQLVGGKTGDSDLHLVSLIEWLEGHYPTQVISSRHFKMLSQFHPHMDKAVLVQIHKWSKECTQHSNEKNCGLENVRLFYSIVEKIKEITHEIISL